MKLVFLSYFSGQVDRGVETFVDAVASRLTKSHSVTVIQGQAFKISKPYSIEVIPSRGVPLNVPTLWYRRIFLDFNSLQIARFTWQSLKLIKKIKPDIIIPTNGGWQTVLVKLFCLFNKSKWVISGQVGLGWDEKWNLFWQPELFVALSERNRKWTNKVAPKQRVVVIPNGVDLNKFKNLSNVAGRQKLKIKIEEVENTRTPSFAEASTIVETTADKSAGKASGENECLNTKYQIPKVIPLLPRPIILCVAGPELPKRVKDTIRAVAQLEAGSLVLAGGSEATQHLGEMLLKDRFIQLTVTHDSMPELYAEVDLFTLVSESVEAFGIAYLEALASGLPVVATDDELRHEIIGEAGLYVSEPTDPSIYASVLQHALEKDWGETPRQRAELFSWDRIAKAYEKALIKLLTPPNLPLRRGGISPS